MFGKIFKKQKSGAAITARSLNQPTAETERQSKLSVSGGLSLWDGPGGPQIRDVRSEPFWAKLTSGSGAGPYAWTEQIPATNGTWTTGFLSGTTSAQPAYNSLGSVTLTLPVFVLMRLATEVPEYRFTQGTC